MVVIKNVGLPSQTDLGLNPAWAVQQGCSSELTFHSESQCPLLLSMVNTPTCTDFFGKKAGQIKYLALSSQSQYLVTTRRGPASSSYGDGAYYIGSNDHLHQHPKCLTLLDNLAP